jgi:UMF1 family MFS transporter
MTDGNHRLAIAATGLFFVVGLFLLRPINIERGMTAARAYDANPSRLAAVGSD